MKEKFKALKDRYIEFCKKDPLTACIITVIAVFVTMVLISKIFGG